MPPLHSDLDFCGFFECTALRTQLAPTQRMVSLRFLTLAPAFVSLLSSCTVVTDGWTYPASAQTEPGDKGGADSGGGQPDLPSSKGGGTHAGSAGNSARGGSAGNSARGGSAGNSAHGGSAGTLGQGAGTGGDNAGNQSSGGAGPTTDPVPSDDPVKPPESCDLDESCTAACEESIVTCGVEPTNTVCELQGFTGATAQVSCGRRAVVGMACCGGCGCVPVEVFFDGTYCWQGVPQCGGTLGNQMLFPHPPTTPNLSYTLPGTVPGLFYLGSGGFGGNNTAGTAGAESAGSAGTGGAPQAGAGASGTTQ